MFNVSIREYFTIYNVFIVCIRNTAMFKLIPVLCTNIYSYMFSTVHPPRVEHHVQNKFATPILYGIFNFQFYDIFLHIHYHG